MKPKSFKECIQAVCVKILSEKYPVIAQGCGVFCEPHGGYIFSYEEQNGVKRPSSTLDNINVQACAILEHCTGSKTVKEIAHILEKKFEDIPPDLVLQVESFLDTVFEKGYISYSDEPVELQGVIRGSTAYYTPTQVLIEVTAACNLACGHCLISAGKPLPDELSVSQFIAIVERLYEMGVLELTLSGGEILTKRGWDTFLDFCVSRFDPALLTNSILVTEKTAENLARCKELYVSLYGADAETYEGFAQVKGSFEKALRSIPLLTQQSAPVSASIPMTPLNLEQLEDIINLAISLKCDTARVGMVIPLGRARTCQWELTKDQKEWLDAHMAIFRRKYEEAITIQWEEDFEKEENKCGAGYNRWAVASNGDVYPCVLFRIPIGNLTQEDPVDICASSAIEFLQEVETPHQGICGDCSLLHLCYGCHGQAYARYFKVNHCKWAEQFEKAPEPLKNAIVKRKNEKKK